MSFTKTQARASLENFAKHFGIPMYENQLELMADLMAMPEHQRKAALRRIREPIDIKRLTFVAVEK